MDVISAKATSRIYFLKQLKRTDAQISDLLHFYTVIIHPVCEHASPVWHSSLTATQSEALESLQKRTLQIIYDDGNYTLILIMAETDSLKTHHEYLTIRFFQETSP